MSKLNTVGHKILYWRLGGVILRRNSVFILFLAVGLVFTLGCSQNVQARPAEQPANKDFIIAGSGQNFPLTSKLVYYYNKKYKGAITLPNSIGTNGAKKAVKAGAIDLGLTAWPLTEADKQEGLKEIPYARVGIIIGVDPDVPDENLTYQELVDIFTGKKTQWQNGQTITVLSREYGDSTNRVMVSKVPGYKEALINSLNNELWTVCFTDQEEAHAVENTPFSIGFTNIAALKAQQLSIKPLKVNGVAPTVENIKNGSYPLFVDLYFVHKGKITNRAKNFLDFVFSDEGQKLLVEYNSIPLKGM